MEDQKPGTIEQIQKIIDERIAQDLVTEEDIDNLEVPEL